MDVFQQMEIFDEIKQHQMQFNKMNNQFFFRCISGEHLLLLFKRKKFISCRRIFEDLINRSRKFPLSTEVILLE